MSYNKPLPKLDPLTTPFWEHARRNILALQTCRACNDAHLPPSPVCPKCLSTDQDWKPASGRGVLEAYAEFHRAYWPGFNDDIPYSSAIVRLEEGPLMATNLVGDTTNARVGKAVEVVFDKVSPELTLPKFRCEHDS